MAGQHVKDGGMKRPLRLCPGSYIIRLPGAGVQTDNYLSSTVEAACWPYTMRGARASSFLQSPRQSGLPIGAEALRGRPRGKKKKCLVCARFGSSFFLFLKKPHDFYRRRRICARSTLARTTPKLTNLSYFPSKYSRWVTYGAKAQQKRERNQKDAKSKGSQLKVNAAAKDIQCQICKATFLKTTKAPALTEHAENKHSKGLADCFPSFIAA
nr:uncharacterized protein CTRU02_02509 [Colletotrichum truncatum]KAF6798536.1 hypothetical protein CTRU02_02509 [Colletotrichum truncatum]